MVKVLVLVQVWKGTWWIDVGIRMLMIDDDEEEVVDEEEAEDTSMNNDVVEEGREEEDDILELWEVLENNDTS